MPSNPTAILLINCADQRGLVASISNFIFQNQGNIIHADQHIDNEFGSFLMRVEWDLNGFQIPRDEIADRFGPIAAQLNLRWELRFSDALPRLAIMVSKYRHCLDDLLLRNASGELKGEIALIIANHSDLEPIAKAFSIPFYVFPINVETKYAQEQKELELLSNQRIDLVVLARYMQVLSPEFVSSRPNRIINIHHSFLPAFVGARPYPQA